MTRLIPEWVRRANAHELPVVVVGGAPRTTPEPPRKPRPSLYRIERVRDVDHAA